MKEGTRQFREIKRIVTECYQQLYVNKLDNLEEMNKLRKQATETEPGRNRKSEQTNDE